MADAAVPILNLAILGSFFGLGLIQLRQSQQAQSEDDRETR